jgi:hypothetical protein
MATESSAVVRFINSAQQQHQTIQDSGVGLPDFTDDLKPIRRSYKVPLFILGALAFAGVAAVAGVYVGKHYFSGGKTARQLPARAQAAQSAAQPAAPAATAGAAATAPASEAPPLAPAPIVAPVIAPEVLAETGFDIRVKPPATISLDGRLLGRAPLRVRNLTPGPHVIDIEAPAGYFSRRVDIELDAGEPQNVNLALDPIEPGDQPAAGDDDDDEPDRSRRDKRKSQRKARKASRRGGRKAREAEAETTPAVPGEKGTLLLGSKPPCDIFIDGAATGLKTPQRAIELTAGSHKITLVNTDLDIKKTFTVEIVPGKSTRAIHDLTGKID